jgi:hypothetical protein
VPVRLDAPAGTLPLAYAEIGSHLLGERDAFTARGRELDGDRLTAALAREGIGPKEVAVAGYYHPFGQPPNVLVPWSYETIIAGTLDAHGLARLAPALARAWRAEHFPAGNTPPEVYTTLVFVSEAGKAPKQLPRQRRAPKIHKRIRYRDTKTGHYVSAKTWKRSRSQLKGKPGRYKRVIETWIE